MERGFREGERGRYGHVSRNLLIPRIQVVNSLRETGGSRKRDTVPFSVITNKGLSLS